MKDDSLIQIKKVLKQVEILPLPFACQVQTNTSLIINTLFPTLSRASILPE